MPKSKDKTKSPDVEVSKVTKYLDEALNAWRAVQLNWFIYDGFYKGNHYLSLNTLDFSIKNVPQGATIPYIYHVVRIIANNVSKVTPKWDFIPNQADPRSVDEAYKIGLMMDKVFETANISQLLRDGEKEALKFSACPFFVGWDSKNNRCKITLENPFYVMPDPRARSLQDAKYVIRVVETDYLSLKNNPDYEQSGVEKLQPEIKIGGTPIYERVVTETNKIYPNQGEQSKDNFTVFAKELYEKVEDNGVMRIKLTIVCQDSLLYSEVTDLEDFPFEFLYSDKDPLSFYGEGWVKSLIPINKMINKIETQKAVYIDKVAYPRYRLPLGATIQRKNVNGVDVTYYDRLLNDAPEPEPIPAWPVAADQSITAYNTYMRMFGAFSDIATGAVPPGIEAAKALEILVNQDDNNTVEVKKNLIDFTKRLAKKVLWNYSHYLSEVQTMQLNETETAMGMEGQPIPDENGDPMKLPKEIRVIGANTVRGQDMKMRMDANGADAHDIVMLPSDLDIRVDIGSEMAATEQGRRELVMEMVDRGLLPQETALDLLKVGNIRDVIRKFDEERAKQAELEAGKQPPPPDEKPKISIGFKDLPIEAQIQYLQQLGLYPTEEEQQQQLRAQLMSQQPMLDEGTLDAQIQALQAELAANGQQ